MPTQKEKYIILFDTSGIFMGNPFKKEVTEFIHKFKNNNNFLFEYYIPEVAKEEFKKNIYLKIKELESKYYLKGQEGIKEILDISLPKSKLTKNKILLKIEKIFKKYKINTIITPQNKLNIKTILKKAIWYQPPFDESTKEKGFKDYVIYQTFLSFIIKNKNINISIICIDLNLRNYCIKTLSKYKKVKVYEKIENLESDIEFRLAKISQQKQKNLLFQARNEFLSLISREDLINKIQSEFSTYFKNPPEYGLSFISVNDDWNWKPTYEQISFDTNLPTLKGKLENKFIWENKVEIEKQYYRDELDFFAWRSSQQTSTTRRFARFKFVFLINWESNIVEDKITSSRYLNTTYENTIKYEQYGNTLLSGLSYNPSLTQSTASSGTTLLSELKKIDE